MWLAFKYIVITAYFVITGLALSIAIYKRKKRFVSLFFTVIFIGMSSYAYDVYNRIEKKKSIESTKFLGDYKLLKLNNSDCDNCMVRLNENYRYEILNENKIVGKGKWDIQTAFDIPNYFLVIDNGPNNVIPEHERLIEYITNK
jgi:hypothetical protein